jgi:hypothetical protein
MDQEKMRKSLEMHFKNYKPPMKEGEEEKVESSIFFENKFGARPEYLRRALVLWGHSIK